jgi:hypothetical protein
MTKEQAIEYMISKIEELERERLSHQPDPNKQRQETVDAIIKAIKGVEIDNAN